MKWRLVIAVLVAIGLGSAAGVASAADITIPDGPLEVGSATVNAPSCPAGGATFSNVRTVYSSNTYRIGTLTLSALNANCRSDAYIVATTDNGTVKTELGEWTGTTPGTNTGTLTPGTASDAGNVNGVNATNEQVRLYLIVTS